MSYLFFEEDDSSPQDRLFNFGKPIDSKSLASSYNQRPLISYKFIDLIDTDYCFDQPCLDADDMLYYFELLKEFSQLTINELIDGHYTKHFHLYHRPNSKLKKLLETISGKELKPETTPTIGQFALYTKSNGASRETGVKSPRIYFIVGENAIIYILFYDPYHEIHGTKNI